MLRHQEPMSRHTSWRVGGPADRFYEPAGLDDLAAFLKSLPPDEPLTWVGLGSNLLVRDGGIRGTVLMLSGKLNGLERLDETTVRAEAGVASAKLARFGVGLGLRGAEFLAGVPGTVGGALAMNAGAFGGETWNVVSAVETINHRGERNVRLPQDYQIGYRHVEGPEGEWFVAGHFRLEPGSETEGQALIKSLLAKRGASQPTQWPNAGSVFRNPPADHAARLIEATGLKGLHRGGAVVSALHANFIINEGDATAADIEALIAEVQRKVAAAHGIRLEPEVRVIGEPL
ncbi:MAG: UDP-N-acetylmuramate dehydrogenase [Gammaproteobacteria bacterium]|nr:UDP-N-acetylmuramate dehydrogenase [Gammaproteobacteria bacterium]